MSTRATTDGPQQPGPGLALAFLVALLLHAGALGVITYWRGAPPTPPGENEVTIDLAPPLEAVEVPSEAQDTESTPPPADVVTEQKPIEPPTELSEVKPPDTVAETPPETVTETKPPETVTEALPPEPVTETRPPETVAEVPPEAVQAVEPPQEQVITSTSEAAQAAVPPPPAMVARPVEEPKPPKPPKPKPVPKPVEAKKPPPPKPVREVRRDPPKPAAERATEPQRQRRSTAYASRQNAAGSAAAPAAADPGAMRIWGQQIQSAIRGRVRNPGGGGGTVTIRFTVARSGRVLGASLVGSSGNGSLDAAALAAASGSLPAAPDGVTVAQQSFSVPLRFQ
ncbi:TonB family protein [Methylobacterium oryzisoli]|uniref:TonB family protein n=1 Tax=Methylobacterium oryzisoli TaxID=3385502 RepID=UPI003891DEFB